jgi:endonuclease YncB( thermonuclease family)
MAMEAMATIQPYGRSTLAGGPAFSWIKSDIRMQKAAQHARGEQSLQARAAVQGRWGRPPATAAGFCARALYISTCRDGPPSDDLMRTLLLLALPLVLLLDASVSGAQAPIRSYAIVRDDASLIVRSRVINLFGIFIPQTEQVCESRIRPAQCGTRAARALRLKIQGFIECLPQARYRNGSLSAVCYADGDSMLDPPVDLGAWLIQQGLAAAGPGAPFEYQVYERIARSNERGFWGFQVDQIR